MPRDDWYHVHQNSTGDKARAHFLNPQTAHASHMPEILKAVKEMIAKEYGATPHAIVGDTVTSSRAGGAGGRAHLTTFIISRPSAPPLTWELDEDIPGRTQIDEGHGEPLTLLAAQILAEHVSQADGFRTLACLLELVA